VKIADDAGLFRIRRFVSRLAHHDEHLSDRTVTLTSGAGLVGSIACASDALARTAEQICYGIRLRRSNAAAWAASELALAA
jgi:preprotein translocase subunit SecD